VNPSTGILIKLLSEFRKYGWSTTQHEKDLSLSPTFLILSLFSFTEQRTKKKRRHGRCRCKYKPRSCTFDLIFTMKDVISIMITQEKKKVPLFTNLIEDRVTH